MFSEKLKPKLELMMACNIAEVRERVLNGLTLPGHPCTGTVLREHIMLKMKDSVRHYWSPVLNMDLYEVEQGTQIKGNFGPHPNVWAMFVVFYCVLAMFSILGVMFGISQLLIEQFPSGFLTIPLCLVVAGLITLFGFKGQKKANSQIQELRNFLEEILTEEQPQSFPQFY